VSNVTFLHYYNNNNNNVDAMLITANLS
jgi:hypothetical protein